MTCLKSEESSTASLILSSETCLDLSPAVKMAFQSFSNLAKSLHKKSKTKIFDGIELKNSTIFRLFGIFLFTQPLFAVNDAELVKQIMLKEFDSFMNHNGNFSRISDGIFGKSVLLLEDNSWREMRNTL
jgi:cytochrome P450